MAANVNVLLWAFLVSALFASAYSISCYECNVWKAGYGQLCDNPKIRTDCKVCMKVETNSYIVRYSDTPRHSQIISRVCGNYEMTHFGVECHYYTTADGYSTRCYCDSDLCNSAPSTSRHSPINLLAACLLASVTWVVSRLTW